MIHHVFRHSERAAAGALTGTRRARSGLGFAGLVLATVSCAGGGAAPATAPAQASEAEWRALAAPRPEPLPGAPRVSFSGVELTAAPAWPTAASVPPDLGLSELVVAGLLRRRDVRLVERRRFAAAAEAERAGRPRAPGAPSVGVSAGAELTAGAVWVPLGTGAAAVEVRLTDSATGEVVRGRRISLPPAADMVGAARAIVSAVLATLDELGRLPVWNDPAPGAAPRTYVDSGIPNEAVQRFLVGLAAEEQWNWEAARRSYQAAAVNGFVEADAALARTARLRQGGTLGES